MSVKLECGFCFKQVEVDLYINSGRGRVFSLPLDWYALQGLPSSSSNSDDMCGECKDANKAKLQELARISHGRVMWG